MRKISAFLASSRSPWLFAVLALLLGLPSIDNGFIIDDHFHRAALSAPDALPEIARSPLELFAWVGEDWRLSPGFLPWWASPDLHVALFRPLTGLTHGLDAVLWPDAPRLIHAHSLLYFAVTVFAAACLYRRLVPDPDGTDRVRGWTAGLAGLAFALDDAHAVPAGWIANRNAILPALFVVLTIFCYDRLRRDGWRPGLWLTPLCFGLGLLSGESALGAAGYLVAYALFLDHGTWRQRLLRLVPAAAVGAAWAVAYEILGYGARGSTLYVDPASEPLRFLAAALDRAPRLLMAQLGLLPSDLANLVSQDVKRALWIAAVAGLAVLGALCVPLLRHDARARFWALGLVLSTLPSCGAFSSDRLLFVPGLGGMALVAMLVASAFGRAADGRATGVRAELPRAWRWTVRPVAAGLLVVHLVLAPLLFLVGTMSVRELGETFNRVIATFPDDAALGGQTAVVTHVPTVFFTGLAQAAKAVDGKPVPADMLVLATSLYPVEVERSGERTLVVRPEGGFLLPPGQDPPGRTSPPVMSSRAFQTFEWLFRAEGEPFPTEPIVRGDVTITVVDWTEDGRPAAVEFAFGRPLDDPGWRWLQWREAAFVAFEPPAVGERVRLPSWVE